MAEVKLSSKNQIVIPREAREKLRLKPGTKLLVVVLGENLILRRKPKRYSEAIKGLARGLYPPDYLEKERESWD